MTPQTRYQRKMRQQACCTICSKPLSGRKATCPERCRSQWRETRRLEAQLRRLDAEKRRGKWAA